MGNHRDFLRQCALDELHLNKSFARVTDYSAALQQILGFGDSNEPFTAPLPLPSPNGHPTSQPPSTSLPLSHPLQRLHSFNATAASAGIKDGLGYNVSFERADVATSVSDTLSQPSSLSVPPLVLHSSQKHAQSGVCVKPLGRAHHPDPRSSPPENQHESKQAGFVRQDAATRGDVDRGSEESTLGALRPQTSKNRCFTTHEQFNKEYLQYTETNGPSNATISRNIEVYHFRPTAQLSFQPQGPAAPRNIVPGIERLFEQWIRYGYDCSDGFRMLRPREIPITSVTARTLPCISIGSPGEEIEKPTKLFTITVNQDVAELKLLQCEVLPESAANRKFSLNIKRRPYHETSAADPNIWTILFIREKQQLDAGGSRRSSGNPEANDGTHVAEKRRRVQDPAVEAPSTGQDVQHSWQMIAWPSAHVTKYMEVYGPIQEKVSDEGIAKRSPSKTASRTPLAPKVVQIRQPPAQPPSRDRLAHLKDSQSFAGYKTAAQEFVESNQYFNVRAAQVVLEKENSSGLQSTPLQRPFSKVNIVAGEVDTFRDTPFNLPGLSITEQSEPDSVLVYETQRLTCLRFLRGGNLPLLTGSGVDLGYWNDFCEYFARGEVQLEIISSTDGEPVVLSGTGEVRGNGAEQAASLRGGGKNKNKNKNKKCAADTQAVSGPNSRAADTPSSQSSYTTADEGNHDNLRSTQPLQRNGTSTQRNGISMQRNDTPMQGDEAPTQRNDTPMQRNDTSLQRTNASLHSQVVSNQRGTGGSFQPLPNVTNTANNRPSHQRPNSAFARPDFLRSTPTSSQPNANSAAPTLPQHSQSHSNTSAPRPQLVATNSSNTAGGITTPGTSAPHGWQTEVQNSLEQNRPPAWNEWTDRSQPYQQRQAQAATASQASADRALRGNWPDQLAVLAEPRARRDAGNSAMQCYREGAQLSQQEMDEVVREGIASCRAVREWSRLRERERRAQPLRHLDRVRREAEQRRRGPPAQSGPMPPATSSSSSSSSSSQGGVPPQVFPQPGPQGSMLGPIAQQLVARGSSYGMPMPPPPQPPQQGAVYGMPLQRYTATNVHSSEFARNEERIEVKKYRERRQRKTQEQQQLQQQQNHQQQNVQQQIQQVQQQNLQYLQLQQDLQQGRQIQRWNQQQQSQQSQQPILQQDQQAVQGSRQQGRYQPDSDDSEDHFFHMGGYEKSVEKNEEA
ncbi:hypothetical protein GTA08_BOTSDO03721 [Botryosphaeria dothidea]|uniref:Uncharacterized protein n=1 Tax=Botryosphaeria dothidea TaxID=55169 RepID=A0A8H4IUK8_9PEZI|nr:hypothetical protein GTA08_BOTSDO03721 [Botryosphaeria dothidea]